MVNQTHEKYDYFIGTWQKNRDAAAGQKAIKARGTTYLPKLSGHNDPVDGQPKYDVYKEYALWYSATGRTVDGLHGLIFRKPPQIEYPESIKDGSEFIRDDLTLNGKSITEILQEIVTEVIIVNRVGIMIDIPTITPGLVDEKGMVTVATLEKENIRPYVSIYEAEDIINWSHSRVNNKWVLSKVVLKEILWEQNEDDEFKIEKIEQYRVLDLAPMEEGSNNVYYRQRVYKSNRKVLDKGESPLDDPVDEFFPRVNGENLDYIPFFIVSAKGEDWDIDYSIINGLSDVNIAHYRNSANYENGLMWTGNPTPVLSGYPEDKEEVKLGSTEALILSIGGDAKFLEFTGTGLSEIRQAMEKKEGIMAALGARIIAAEKRQVEAAETAEIHRAGENGVLANVANSVSIVMSKVLGIISEWSLMNAADQISIELNTDYIPTGMDPQMLSSLVQAVQSGAISPQTFFYNLQKGELIPAGVDYDTEQALLQEAGPALGMVGLVDE